MNCMTRRSCRSMNMRTHTLIRCLLMISLSLEPKEIVVGSNSNGSGYPKKTNTENEKTNTHVDQVLADDLLVSGTERDCRGLKQQWKWIPEENKHRERKNKHTRWSGACWWSPCLWNRKRLSWAQTAMEVDTRRKQTQRTKKQTHTLIRCLLMISLSLEPKEIVVGSNSNGSGYPKKTNTENEKKNTHVDQVLADDLLVSGTERDCRGLKQQWKWIPEENKHRERKNKHTRWSGACWWSPCLWNRKRLSWAQTAMEVDTRRKQTQRTKKQTHTLIRCLLMISLSLEPKEIVVGSNSNGSGYPKKTNTENEKTNTHVDQVLADDLLVSGTERDCRGLKQQWKWIPEENKHRERKNKHTRWSGACWWSPCLWNRKRLSWAQTAMEVDTRRKQTQRTKKQTHTLIRCLLMISLSLEPKEIVVGSNSNGSGYPKKTNTENEKTNTHVDQVLADDLLVSGTERDCRGLKQQWKWIPEENKHRERKNKHTRWSGACWWSPCLWNRKRLSWAQTAMEVDTRRKQTQRTKKQTHTLIRCLLMISLSLEPKEIVVGSNSNGSGYPKKTNTENEKTNTHVDQVLADDLLVSGTERDCRGLKQQWKWIPEENKHRERKNKHTRWSGACWWSPCLWNRKRLSWAQTAMEVDTRRKQTQRTKKQTYTHARTHTDTHRKCKEKSTIFLRTQAITTSWVTEGEK